MKTKVLDIFCLLIIIGFSACNHKSGKLPPDRIVKNYDRYLVKTDKGWFYKNRLFSGYMVQVETDGRIVYKLPVIDGKENGIATGSYNTGEKLLERSFVNGEKEGVFIQWWPNGNLRYLFRYHHNQYNGKQIVYFHFGKIQEEKNYTNGIEEGSQKIWDSTGRLVSNYLVKNNKMYGSLSSEECMPVVH